MYIAYLYVKCIREIEVDSSPVSQLFIVELNFAFGHILKSISLDTPAQISIVRQHACVVSDVRPEPI